MIYAGSPIEPLFMFAADDQIQTDRPLRTIEIVIDTKRRMRQVAGVGKPIDSNVGGCRFDQLREVRRSAFRRDWELTRGFEADLNSALETRD